MKNALSKFIYGYDKLEEYLLVGSLVFNVLLIFAQIIMRGVFNYSLTWSEEVSRYVFIWQIWLGTSIAVRTEQHIQVKLLLKFVKTDKAQKIIRLLGLLIWFGFSLYLAYLGYNSCISMMSHMVASTILRIPMWIVYVALPVSSLLVSLRLVWKIIQQATELGRKAERRV